MFGFGFIVVPQCAAEVLFQLLRHAGSELRRGDYGIVWQFLAYDPGSAIGILEG
jgi:hypothetical protein